MRYWLVQLVTGLFLACFACCWIVPCLFRLLLTCSLLVPLVTDLFLACSACYWLVPLVPCFSNVDQRFIEIKQQTFTPLVFGTNGAMAKECQIFHRLLVKKLSVKRNKKYCVIMALIRTQFSFSLLCSILLCIRSSQTVF